MIELSVEELRDLRARGEQLILLDVRQPWEHELARLADDVLIPLHELPARLDELDLAGERLVLCYCHHGIRSLNAAAFLERNGAARVAWSQRIDPAVARY
jgi:rhodanese-related sulfurtransferase